MVNKNKSNLINKWDGFKFTHITRLYNYCGEFPPLIKRLVLINIFKSAIMQSCTALYLSVYI